MFAPIPDVGVTTATTKKAGRFTSARKLRSMSSESVLTRYPPLSICGRLPHRSKAASRILDEARVQLGGLFDAHAVVVVDGSPAHVGVARVDSSVDRRALLRKTWPTAFGAGDHARTHAIAYIRDGKERAASVGHAHLVPGCNFPGSGIIGMDKQRCGSRPLALPRHVGEDRIQEVVIGGCDESERILANEGGVTLR